MERSSPLVEPLVPDDGNAPRRWKRISFLLVTVVGVLLIGLFFIAPIQFNPAGHASLASSNLMEGSSLEQSRGRPSVAGHPSVSDILKLFPAPEQVKQVNDLFGQLPAHDQEDAVFQHIAPHAEQLFIDFLKVFGSTAPHFKTKTRPKAARHKLKNVKEFNHRLDIFKGTLRVIIEHNNVEALHNLRPDRARFGITKFADWTWTEFETLLTKKPSIEQRQRHSAHQTTPEASSSEAFNATHSVRDNMLQRARTMPHERQGGSILDKAIHLKPGNTTTTTTMINHSISAAPCAANWAVKYPSLFRPLNQRSCGGCYAFAAIEELHALSFIRNGVDPGELSVQYVLDCLSTGCEGGDAGDVMNWAHRTGGIPTRSEYGCFVGEEKKCKTGIPKSVTTTGAERFFDEESTAKKLCSDGPLSMGVNANSAWQTYVSGVLSVHSCPANDVNHDTQVVGLLQDKGAWLVRNSWGPDYGVSAQPPYAPNGTDSGFIMLEYGTKTCNCIDCNSFPKDVSMTGVTTSMVSPATTTTTTAAPVAMLCSNTCGVRSVGECLDGGPNSTRYACNYGTDCVHCGVRPDIYATLCANTCLWYSDGYCDDGGPNSDDFACDYGTDCTDCGIRKDVPQFHHSYKCVDLGELGLAEDAGASSP